MTTVSCVLRSLQPHHRHSLTWLSRLHHRASTPVFASVITNTSKKQLHTYRRSLSLLPARQLSSETPNQPSASDTENEVDIGPGTWKEIYHGILSTQIKMIKIFSFSTSLIGLSFQPILFQKVLGTGFGVVVAVGSFVGFFTFITPLLIHWITKKYVTSLEYDVKRDVYSATTLSFLMREKKIHFTVDDVKVPEIPGMFTTFLVKNQPLFVDPRMFKEMEHYGRLMGYDKPINFYLGEEGKKE